MAQIGRLLTAMVTPFDERGQVDYKEAGRLANALVDSGSDGLVVSGTTGESPTLSTEEKLRLFAEVKKAVGKRAAVVAGATNYNTAESIELSKEAEHEGVDAILMTVPYYNKPPQEGLYQHFKAIAGAVHIPGILYNVPGRTSLNMTAETTIRLSKIDNIAGFKVWSGDDNKTFFIMCAGGYGVVSVASHLVGNQIKAMMGLVLEGNIEAAGAEHRRLLDIFKGIFIVTNPIPIKYLVGRAGFATGKPRLPLVPPDDATAKKLDDLMARYDIDLKAPGKAAAG
jgi:4-hydroxy-tetrahydrodipicolinate synthase